MSLPCLSYPRAFSTGARQPYVPQPIQRTLVVIKPDAVERGLTGKILNRFLQRGLKLIDLRLIKPNILKAQKLYQEHTHKPFFETMIQYFTRGPIVAMVLEGEEAVPTVRKIIGDTNTLNALPGSIRGDYAIGTTFNLIHGSDTEAAAKREIDLYFDKPTTPAYSNLT